MSERNGRNERVWRCAYVRTYLFREVIDQLTVDEAVDAVTDNLLTPVM